MEKAAGIRLIQCELNDFYGVCIKIAGPAGAVSTAIEAGRHVAETMGGKPVADVILRSDDEATKVIVASREFSPLIQQDVVLLPRKRRPAARLRRKERL